jgi:hypothetical protein
MIRSLLFFAGRRSAIGLVTGADDDTIISENPKAPPHFWFTDDL